MSAPVENCAVYQRSSVEPVAACETDAVEVVTSMISPPIAANSFVVVLFAPT